MAMTGVWMGQEPPAPSIAGTATETSAGIAQIATPAEVLTGTNAVKIVTPATLTTKVNVLILDGGFF